MTHYYRCGHGPKVYKFQFGFPHFFHGMGGFDLDLELDTKEDAEKFMKHNRKWLVSKKERLENHLKKLNTALERLDTINAELAQNENYDAKAFQKKLIKEFKKFMIEQIDEE